MKERKRAFQLFPPSRNVCNGNLASYMVTLFFFFKHITQSGISFPALRVAFLERWGGLPSLFQCENIFCSELSFSSVFLTRVSFKSAVTTCSSFASPHTIIPKFWWESIIVSLHGLFFFFNVVCFVCVCVCLFFINEKVMCAFGCK